MHIIILILVAQIDPLNDTKSATSVFVEQWMADLLFMKEKTPLKPPK